MKLLAITGYYKPAYVYGGPVRSESSLFESLAELGVSVTVITTNANGKANLNVPLLTEINVNGVQVIYCPINYFPGTPFFSFEQIRIAKKFIPKMDVINLQTFWGLASLPLSQFSKLKRIPYYVSLRGQLMDYSLKKTSLEKRLKKYLFLKIIGNKYLNNASALHCTSEIEMIQLEQYKIHTPTFLIPNSFDVKSFRKLPERGEFRKKLNISKDALVMVFIGRLDPVKNPEVAVKTLIYTQKLSNPVHLIMVGPDEYHLQISLKKLAYEAGCLEKLHFTGLLNKDLVLQVMADSDLFIMPSESENFGMSAAESLAAGLPILVSENVPVGTWAKQVNAGEIASVDDESFYLSALKLLSDRKKLYEMSKNGMRSAISLFDNKVVAEKMLNSLEKIMSNYYDT